MEIKKMFYTMGEVTEMFDVNSSLIRYWESQFNIIKPVRNKKGNRLFTPKDIENFKLIYHLVKERGMTLEGAKKTLRGGKLPEDKDLELMDRLLNIRSLLLEVREVLKEDGVEEDEDLQEATPSTLESSADANIVINEDSSTTKVDTIEQAETSAKQTTEEISKEKELFAFYEQNLF